MWFQKLSGHLLCGGSQVGCGYFLEQHIPSDVKPQATLLFLKCGGANRIFYHPVLQAYLKAKEPLKNSNKSIDVTPSKSFLILL